MNEEMLEYKIRNAVEIEPGIFDCEILHPTKGWLPHTCAGDDSDPTGRARHKKLCDTKNFRQMTKEERTTRIQDKHDFKTRQARNRRTSLLAETDFIMMPDVWPGLTPEKQNEWTAYRTALRDAPKQTGFPETIDWPVKP
jgi:hypothetical protein